MRRTGRMRLGCGRVVGVMLMAAAAEESSRTAAVLSSQSRAVASWWRRVSEKAACVRWGKGGLYLYHARKAAGTTVRLVLQEAARKNRVRLWETEGLSIDARFVALRSVVTVVSVRDPVARALSLYWYEHVGWWDGVRHDHSQLRTLESWIEEWRDGGAWKRAFAAKNPQSVYLEVENYMTKMLSGWNRDGRGDPVDEAAFERATTSLHRFDVVFVCERSRQRNHTALLALAVGLDPDRVDAVLAADKLKADHAARKRLAPRLAPDLAKARATLAAINSFDLRLYAAALALDDARAAFRDTIALSRGSRDARPADCETPPARHLDAKNGIFRPPGHKH